MNTFRVLALSSAILAAQLLADVPPAVAQTAPGSATQSMNNLPPALRAAVLSGNSQAVTQAINTLSGGNPQRSAALANSVVSAAEGLLAVNPQAAVRAAAAAVETVRNTSVNTAAPNDTATTLTTAARIFVSPVVTTNYPTDAANLAVATMAVASVSGSPAAAAGIAVQAVTVAERILALNPAAAVQIAGIAVQTVGATAVSNSAPTQSMEVATSAARIVVNPEAQRVAPAAVASLAVNASQVVSNPVVYQSSPQGAIGVMANAYSAVTNQTVSAAAPGATQSVTTSLNQASNSQALAQANVTNASQINAILNGQSTPNTQLTTQTQQAQTQQTQTQQTQTQNQQTQNQQNNNTQTIESPGTVFTSSPS